jgi:hypothetical protein
VESEDSRWKTVDGMKIGREKVQRRVKTVNFRSFEGKSREK